MDAMERLGGPTPERCQIEKVNGRLVESLASEEDAVLRQLLWNLAAGGVWGESNGAVIELTYDKMLERYNWPACGGVGGRPGLPRGRRLSKGRGLGRGRSRRRGRRLGGAIAGRWESIWILAFTEKA